LVTLCCLFHEMNAAVPAAVSVLGVNLIQGGNVFNSLGFTMVGILAPEKCKSIGNEAFLHLNQTELDVAKSWNANTFRFQISYSGLAESSPSDVEAYLERIDSKVTLAADNGFVIILSLQDQSIGCGLARSLPPVDAINVWKTLANKYKGKQYILFELWNEPQNGPEVSREPIKSPTYSSTLTWPDWLNGRNTNITDAKSPARWSPYIPTGHQNLVEAVRSTGATNVILVGGANFCEIFTNIPDLVDSLNPEQIAYSVHPYYFTLGQNGDNGWDARFGNLADTHPMIATEWNTQCIAGASNPSQKAEYTKQQDMAPSFLAYLKGKGIGMTAWSFDITGTLIRNWSYAPTSNSDCTSGHAAGVLVKNHFESYPKT